MDQPKASIVILNWNGLEDTIECLESLREVTYPNYEIIVVDNASTGGDVEALRREYGDYIHIIENDKNYGYGKGFTTGMREAFTRGAKYVLLLHNDTVVATDFLQLVVKAAASHPEFGILAPVSYWYDQPEKIQHGGERARWFGLRSIEVGNLNTEEEVIECNWVPLSCLLMEKEKAIQMGVMPAMEEYFLYGDPVWHLCALRAKLKVGCVPQARIWHKGSRSLKRAGWSRVHWIVRDNFILRFRFLSPSYVRNLTPTQFIFWFRWLFLQRPLHFIRLMGHGLCQGGLRGSLSGLKEGLGHVLGRWRRAGNDARSG